MRTDQPPQCPGTEPPTAYTVGLGPLIPPPTFTCRQTTVFSISKGGYNSAPVRPESLLGPVKSLSVQASLSRSHLCQLESSTSKSAPFHRSCRQPKSKDTAAAQRHSRRKSQPVTVPAQALAGLGGATKLSRTSSGAAAAGRPTVAAELPAGPIGQEMRFFRVKGFLSPRVQLDGKCVCPCCARAFARAHLFCGRYGDRVKNGVQQTCSACRWVPGATRFLAEADALRPAE